MKTKLLLLLLIVALFFAGVATTFYAWGDWGDPASYHGTGVPFPNEYWEAGIHYPAPHGLLFNILFFWIVGFIVLLAIRLIRAALKSRKS
jgi:hypothetical protein